MRRNIGLLVLCILPIALVVIAIGLRFVIGPFEADPEYAYLLNGLNILSFHTPGHFDHPGTTLQEMIGIIVLVVKPFMPAAPGANLWSSVVVQSESYLHAINLALILLDAIALLYLGERVRRVSGLGIALTVQASLFTSITVMMGLVRVTPEPLLLASTLALAGQIAPLALRPDAFTVTRRYAAGLGVLLGFILVTKVTALALPLTILLLPGRQLRKDAAISLFLSALVFSLPIVKHYRAMAGWLIGLVTHSGAYGAGSAGLPTLQTLWQTFTMELTQVPEVFVAFVFLVIAMFFEQGHKRRFLLIASAIVGITILMVLKQPGPRYYMPVIAIIALSSGVIMEAVARRTGLKSITSVLFAIVLGLGIWRNGFATSAWAQESGRINKDNAELIDSVSHSGCRLIFYYSANSPTFRLYFGNGLSGHYWAPTLNKIYPNDIFYIVNLGSFESFIGPLSSREFSQRTSHDRCIYMVGSPIERFDNFGLPVRALSLLRKTNHGVGDALAVYVFRPELTQPGAFAN